jgi:hypothetical protein
MVGTLLMTAAMWFVHRAGWANADMTRALGSLVTRRYEGSLGPGVLIHLAAGIVFAIPYLLIIRSAGFHPWSAQAAVGGAIGTLHGAAVAFVLVALVSERHPVEQFRKAGWEVATAHVVGHIAYGVGVGLSSAMMGRNPEPIVEAARAVAALVAG